MVAPTPISSLVHSSTLVLLGLFFIIRFVDVVSLFWVYLFTVCVSSYGLLCVYDLKEIMAFSTVSHLGIMMMILSLGFKNLVFFYFFVHSLFKSMGFICVGYYMMIFGGVQDLRLLGGFYKL
jgi:NADH-ubiquinone oxidoreductase chain 5